MRTSKQVAVPGDKILIAEEVCEDEKLEKVFYIVSDKECSPGFVLTTDGFIFSDAEYEVVERKQEFRQEEE